MDSESYEQFTIPRDLLGDGVAYLQDGMVISVEFHEVRPLSVRLPEKVTLTIAETEPVVKGQTAASSYKPAIMENGVRVMVPPFVATGDRIVVNTADSTYFERAKN
jgi:elongation factor P